MIAVLLALALVAGCSKGEDPSQDEADTSPAASAGDGSQQPAEVSTMVRQGQVSGAVPPEVRLRVRRSVALVADTWLDAGWVRDDYPTARFPGAFAGFTPAAGRLAAADPKQTTNMLLGRRIDGVEVLDRRVTVDILGVQGTPHGATARVRLAFRTTGQARRHVVVTARLQLSKVLTSTGGKPRKAAPPSPWRVFAYHVQTRTREVSR